MILKQLTFDVSTDFPEYLSQFPSVLRKFKSWTPWEFSEIIKLRLISKANAT